MKSFRTLFAIAAVALTSCLALPMTNAGATPWNPTVTLEGKAFCGGQGMAGAGKSTWVWVEAANGERGWATAGSGYYRFTFRRVPLGNSMKVTVKYGSKFKNDCRATFGLSRPAVGTTAKVNVKQDHWFWF